MATMVSPFGMGATGNPPPLIETAVAEISKIRESNFANKRLAEQSVSRKTFNYLSNV
jgi:hypothetical protein